MNAPTPEQVCPERWHPLARFSVIFELICTASALFFIVSISRGIDRRRILQPIVQCDGHLS
jgi:hypothetical protein